MSDEAGRLPAVPPSEPSSVSGPETAAEGEGEPRIDVRGMIRQASRRVRVDQLVKRGTKYLSLLSREKIDELINQAVRTILQKYSGARPEGIDLEAEAKQDFNELLHQYQQATQARSTLETSRGELAKELDEMHHELEQQKRIAEGRMDEEAERTLLVGFTEFEHEVDRVVRKVFEKRKMILENGDDPESVRELEQVEQKLSPLIRKLVAAERARFSGTYARDREIGLMERRIAKLMEQMKAMENALKMISNQKLFSNQQIANLLRELGLAPEDESFQKKKEMLKVVFEQNVELRKKIRQLQGTAEGTAA